MAVDAGKVNKAFAIAFMKEVDEIENEIDGKIEAAIENPDADFEWEPTAREATVIFEAPRLTDTGALEPELEKELTRRYEAAGWPEVKIAPLLPDETDGRFRIFLTRPVDVDGD